MNIILGASGQVGSAIADHLIKNNEPVRAVIRNPEKVADLESRELEVCIADYFDSEALKNAVKDGELIFVLTPEDAQSEDVIGDTQALLNNYRKAIKSSKINKLIGLSSIGAQHESRTGNLLMSYMLENAFTEISIPQVFVRPAYYYSNWLLYLSIVKEQGILPTFFPVDQKISMISPMDVAVFIADKIINGAEKSATYEIVGPKELSSNDVAEIFGEVLGCDVQAQQIPRERWKKTLQQAGFTDDAAQNLIEMTDAVINGYTTPEGKGSDPIISQTTFKKYLKEII